MPVQLVAEETFTVGTETVVEGPSPTQTYSVVFEDDGRTGYLYGLDRNKDGNPIVDAVQIYNVANVVDRDKPSVAQIVWSKDGLKAGLLINRYSHAVFDFQAKRAYCRTGFPASNKNWTQYEHDWSEDAQELFR